MKIKISSLEYEVIYKKLTGKVGEIFPNQLKIFIDPRLPEDRKRQVILHEVLHAIEADRNLKLSENQIDNLSSGILDFLKNNKGVTDELLRRKA